MQEKNFVEAFQAAVQAALAGKQAGAGPSLLFPPLSFPAAYALAARPLPSRYPLAVTTLEGIVTLTRGRVRAQRRMHRALRGRDRVRRR